MYRDDSITSRRRHSLDRRQPDSREDGTVSLRAVDHLGGLVVDAQPSVEFMRHCYISFCVSQTQMT